MSIWRWVESWSTVKSEYSSKLFRGLNIHQCNHAKHYNGVIRTFLVIFLDSWFQTKASEECRLAVAIHQIDEEVSVIPRGAFIKDLQGLVQVNHNFGGKSISLGHTAPLCVCVCEREFIDCMTSGAFPIIRQVCLAQKQQGFQTSFTSASQRSSRRNLSWKWPIWTRVSISWTL